MLLRKLSQSVLQSALQTARCSAYFKTHWIGGLCYRCHHANAGL